MAAFVDQNDEYTEKIAELKTKVLPGHAELAATYSDAEFRRFLVARNGKVKDAATMLNNSLQWFKTPLKGCTDFKPLTIIEQHQKLPEEALQTPIWQEYVKYDVRGHTRDGCPIYWEGTGGISAIFHEVKKHLTEDELVCRHALVQEAHFKIRAPHASIFYGKEVTHGFVVLDMTGLIVMVDPSAISACIRLLSNDQNNYPERLKAVYVINAPWYFTGIWALITPFLDAKTCAKFKVLGADYYDELIKIVDESNIPEHLGGTRPFTYHCDSLQVDDEEHMRLANRPYVPSFSAATATAEEGEEVA